MEYQEHYSLQAHNTLALEQKARFFVSVNDESELAQAVTFTQSNNIPLLMLGDGSNLVLGQDYPGLVIKNNIKGISVVSTDDHTVTIEAGAGENWHGLVRHALQHNWFGLENLALIPGTVGAAPVQNIGAYGTEISEFVISVRVFDRENKTWKVLSNAECLFAYRDSLFKHHPGRYLISSVQIRLLRAPGINISYQVLRDYFHHHAILLDTITPQQIFDAVVAIRRARLPDPAVMPNAGSFFKNPVIPASQYQALLKLFPALVSYPASSINKPNMDSKNTDRKLAAAWLIDQAGWKGVQQGNVAVHDQQALVLVNRGGASGAELLAFAAKICSDIKQRYNVDLEIEPTVI